MRSLQSTSPPFTTVLHPRATKHESCATSKPADARKQTSQSFEPHSREVPLLATVDPTCPASTAPPPATPKSKMAAPGFVRTAKSTSHLTFSNSAQATLKPSSQPHRVSRTTNPPTSFHQTHPSHTHQSPRHPKPRFVAGMILSVCDISTPPRDKVFEFHLSSAPMECAGRLSRGKYRPSL